MPKTVTLRIDNETYTAFVKRARAQNRSLANFIETAVKEHILEAEFVKDSEMAEILADDRLVYRLRRGSRDAKRKKGTMIG
jgi:hypothetical protein